MQFLPDFALQKLHPPPVPLDSQPHEGSCAGRADVGDLAKGLPRFKVREVDLHCGDAHCQKGVQEGDAGVSVGPGVEDDTIVHAVSVLNPVHQVPLVVGLANVCLQAQPLGGFLDQGQEIVVGGGAVNLRLPLAQEV